MHHFLTLPWHQHQTLHTLMVQHNLSQDLRTKLWSLRTRLLKLFGCLEIYNRFCWHPVDKNPRNKFDSIKKLTHIMYIKVTIFFFFWFAIWLPNGQPWAIIESLIHPMLIAAFYQLSTWRSPGSAKQSEFLSLAKCLVAF